MSDLKQYETRDGPMLGFASDVYVARSLDLYGEYCPGERHLFEQIVHAGQTVVEIGANIGSHTVALARACGPAGSTRSSRSNGSSRCYARTWR